MNEIIVPFRDGTLELSLEEAHRLQHDLKLALIRDRYGKAATEPALDEHGLLTRGAMIDFFSKIYPHNTGHAKKLFGVIARGAVLGDSPIRVYCLNCRQQVTKGSVCEPGSGGTGKLHFKIEPMAIDPASLKRDAGEFMLRPPRNVGPKVIADLQYLRAHL